MFANMSRRWSAVAGAGVAIVIVAAGQLVAAAPAHASAAQQVISGLGTMKDDFDDEATLSRYGPYRHSNAVALWQRILQTEHLYSGAIDCDFGPATEAATIAYQKKYGLSSKDGIVGPQTWGRADDYVDDGGPDGSYPGNEVVLYQPPNLLTGWVADRAVNSGYYSVRLPDGVWVTAWDNQASPLC